jgi:uncharacterized radical SAM superfamily Fe-S cluster-containing enzyme
LNALYFINEINQKRKDIKTTISDKFAKIDEQINELIQEKVAFENFLSSSWSSSLRKSLMTSSRCSFELSIALAFSNATFSWISSLICSSILANLSLMVVYAKAIESSNEHLDEVIKDLRNEEDQLLDKKEDYEKLAFLNFLLMFSVSILTLVVVNSFKI